MKIIKEMLQQANACKEQVAIFNNEWPEGAEITEVNLNRALALKLDLSWIVNNLLSPSQRTTYDQAIAPALATYNKAIAPAGATYKQATASALATYNRAIVQAILEAIK